MKGEFNYTLKKLIELSLAVGKAPIIFIKPLAEIIPAENEEVFSSETTLTKKPNQLKFIRVWKSEIDQIRS